MLRHSKWLLSGLLVAALAGLLFLVWRSIQPKQLGKHFAEATAASRPGKSTSRRKSRGCVKNILVQEGDVVVAGQILAQMDGEVLARRQGGFDEEPN